MFFNVIFQITLQEIFEVPIQRYSVPNEICTEVVDSGFYTTLRWLNPGVGFSFDISLTHFTAILHFYTRGYHEIG